MKDAYEVLYRKEADVARIRQEIESLKIAASLLADGDLSFFPPEPKPESDGKKPAEKAPSEVPMVEATGTGDRAPVAGNGGFWGSLKRRRR